MNISLTDFTLEEFKQFIGLFNKEAKIHVDPISVVKNPKEKIEDIVKAEEPVQPNKEGLITLAEASKALGKAKNTLSYHIKRGNLPHTFDGKTMLINFDILKDYVEKRAMSVKEVKPVEQPKTVEEGTYEDFHETLIKTMKGHNRDAFRSYKILMSKTFAYMTKNYGIVWDQVRKEYKEETKDENPVSTTRLAFWLEQTNRITKNLTVACLDSVCKIEDILK